MIYLEGMSKYITNMLNLLDTLKNTISWNGSKKTYKLGGL